MHIESHNLPVRTPTACTSAVIQASYHQKPEIEAEIHIISLQEWANELQHICDDVIGPGHNRIADKNKEAGIAWAKVSTRIVMLYQSLNDTPAFTRCKLYTPNSRGWRSWHL